MGDLTHRLRTLDHSLAPPSVFAEICWCTSLQSHLQTSPPTPQKLYPKFRHPRTTSKHPPVCSPKYSMVQGGMRGSQNFCCGVESSYFCELGAHAKFRSPSWILSGRKVKTSEKRERNNAFNSGHLSADCWHTHSARTKIKTIIITTVCFFTPVKK